MKQAKLNCGKDKSDHKTSSRKTKLMIQLYKCDDMYVNANLSRLKKFQVIMTNNVSVHIQFNNYIIQVTHILFKKIFREYHF